MGSVDWVSVSRCVSAGVCGLVTKPDSTQLMINIVKPLETGDQRERENQVLTKLFHYIQFKGSCHFCLISNFMDLSPFITA